MLKGTDICVNCIYAKHCGKRRASETFITFCEDYATPQYVDDILNEAIDKMFKQEIERLTKEGIINGNIKPSRNE